MLSIFLIQFRLTNIMYNSHVLIEVDIPALRRQAYSCAGKVVRAVQTVSQVLCG